MYGLAGAGNLIAAPHVKPARTLGPATTRASQHGQRRLALHELRTRDVLGVAPAVMRWFEAGPDGMDVILHRVPLSPRAADTEKRQFLWS
jgi:hypothetical protein